LKGEQDGNGIMPAPDPAALIGGAPIVDHRPGRGAGGAMPGLSLGRGQWPVAKGLAGHGVNSEALRHETDAPLAPGFSTRPRPAGGIRRGV
jgi:hypothetical protein